MLGIDKATGRVIALIVLLALTVVSLRGYLPAVPPPGRRPADSAATPALIGALLGMSAVIVAVAIVSRLRGRRAAAGSFSALSAGWGRGGRRPSWRVLLIGFGVALLWLLIVVLAGRLAWQLGLDQQVPVPGERVGTPLPTDAPRPPAGGEPRPKPWRPNAGAFRSLAPVIAVALLAVSAGIVATARALRDRPGPSVFIDGRGAPAAPADGAESLVRAAELGLEQVGDPGRVPRDAIIACYVTMERELARVPDAMPQECDTPTEVLARAVSHHAVPAANATRLVALFTEARFSPHLMTERHRDDAIRILRLVLTELRRTP